MISKFASVHSCGKNYYIVGKGNIGGTYCEGFHKISTDGKIGYHLDREPTRAEKKQILKDILRHREQLLNELNSLHEAEKVLLK